MSTRLVVLHIGFPKTGTTTLQNRLFVGHPQLVSCGKPTASTAGAAAVDCMSNPSATDADIERARKNWQAELAALPDDGKTVVLSNERLSAHKYYANPEAMIARCARILGGAKIMITTRHQLSLLESYYLHLSKRGNYRTLDDFLADWLDNEIAHLDFHRIAGLYGRRFGADAVGVFPLEQWVQEPARYAARLAAFLHIDALRTNTLLRGEAQNKRRSKRHLAYVALRQKIPLRGIAHLLPRAAVRTFERYLSTGKPARVEIPLAWRQRIEAMHAISNAHLALDYDLDLARFGYAVADISRAPATEVSSQRSRRRTSGAP